MVSFQYYSYIFRDSYGSGMGIPLTNQGFLMDFYGCVFLLISMLSDQLLYPNLQVFEHLGLVFFLHP